MFGLFLCKSIEQGWRLPLADLTKVGKFRYEARLWQITLLASLFNL